MLSNKSKNDNKPLTNTIIRFCLYLILKPGFLKYLMPAFIFKRKRIIQIFRWIHLFLNVIFIDILILCIRFLSLLLFLSQSSFLRLKCYIGLEIYIDYMPNRLHVSKCILKNICTVSNSKYLCILTLKQSILSFN